MAAIDKTYVSSYEDWKRIIDWARTAVFTCPNGTELRAIDYCYYPNSTEAEIKEWLTEQNEIPVMNTSYSMDYFLIKHCPIDIVQERMREVYDDEYYNAVKNGMSEYDTFSRDGKIGTRVVCTKRGNRSNHISRGHYFVHAELDGDTLWYSEAIGRFLWENELGSWSSNCFVGCKTFKALVRRIRKMGLPKGAVVTATGRYVDEAFEFVIH